MVLTKLINKFWKPREDNEAEEFVKKLGGIALRAGKDDPGFMLREVKTYLLGVEKPGHYYIALGNLNNSRMVPASLEKGTYIAKPHIEFAGLNPVGDVIFFSRIDIAPLNTKQGHSLALATLVDNMHFAEQPGILEQAAVIKQKRDKMKNDKRDYTKEIFGDIEPQKKKRSWYKPFIIAAASVAATVCVLGHYEKQADRQREKGWQLEQETKRLAWENDYERRKAIYVDQDAAESARQKEEAEKKRILEEENKRRHEEWLKDHQAKWKAKQEEFRTDLQAILRKTYNADITDLVKEAYASDPVTKKDGPNWTETTFTVKFKQPEYVLRADFRTDWQHGQESITRITTSFAIAKDSGKTISFNEKGEITSHNASEEDKKYVSDFVQKHNIAKARKDVIDAVIKEKGHHQSDVYHGR